MNVFGQNWFWSIKVDVFGQKWSYSGNVVLFGQEWLYSDKSCSIPVSGSIWPKVVVFGQKGFY